MRFHCEDPNKIKNIVNKQFEYFCDDYEKVNYGYYTMINESEFVVNYDQIRKDFNILPDIIKFVLENYSINENNVSSVKEELELFFIEEAKRENFKQMVKGIKTTGVKKSFVYGLRKLKKGINKR